MAIVFRLMVLAIAGLNFACDSSEPKVPAPPPELTTKIEAQQFLLNATDFDLQEVIVMIRDNKIKDAADLEKKINEGNGINNVDLDHDGKIDFVKIKEGRKGNAVALEFLAIPSSTQVVEDAATVASIEFSRSASSNDVQIQGGFPSHVAGHDSSFFSAHAPSIGASIGQALFFAWLFTPSRPSYYHPVMPAYVAHPVLPDTELSQNRRAYSQRSGSDAVKQSAKPNGFDAGATKPRKSFASLKNGSNGGPKPFDTRTAQNPPPSTSSFKRSTPRFRGFRRR